MALERVEQRSLFSADVTALSVHNLNVEGLALPAIVRTEDPFGACFVDGAADGGRRVGVLLADIDIAVGRTHRPGGDHHPLQHTVWVALEDDAVDVGAGVTLIGVADHVLARAGLGVDRPPLAARREACPAATP
jgi:hypothetical protein